MVHELDRAEEGLARPALVLEVEVVDAEAREVLAHGACDKGRQVSTIKFYFGYHYRLLLRFGPDMAVSTIKFYFGYHYRLVLRLGPCVLCLSLIQTGPNLIQKVSELSSGPTCNEHVAVGYRHLLAERGAGLGRPECVDVVVHPHAEVTVDVGLLPRLDLAAEVVVALEVLLAEFLLHDLGVEVGGWRLGE